MKHYRIKLTLINGEIFCGVAKSLELIRESNLAYEVIHLSVENGLQTISLHEISLLEALDVNPFFNQVNIEATN